MEGRRFHIRTLSAFALFLLVVVAPSAIAADAPLTSIQVSIDTVWVVMAGMLVFFMNAGFGLLETGLCRSKNAVNILAKNYTAAALAGLAFYFIGFGLMFSDGNGFIGYSGFMLLGADNSPAVGEAYKGVFSSLSWTGVPLEAKYFFQSCFAMAAASIVSGAVAERIRFQAFLLFSVLLIGLVYSTTGHWIWGGGWLAEKGFHDFAGSTAVHSVGAWAALTGAIMVGPRRGKFTKDGRPRAIPGHSMALAAAGGFILWLGWFAFNAGSTMGSADAGVIAHAATTTLMASMGGIAGALVVSYLRTGGFDLSMMINGNLAGLVGITAGCDIVPVWASVLIGIVAGGLTVIFVELVDKMKIDDPVGAVSVHLGGGVWGTLAVGLFASDTGLFLGGGAGLFVTQLVGVLAVGAFVGASALAIWFVVNKTIGLRASEEEEFMGLDITEMKMQAYPLDDAGGGHLPPIGGSPEAK